MPVVPRAVGRPGFDPRVGKIPLEKGKAYLLQYSGVESMGSQRVLRGLRDFHSILRNVAT